MATDQEKTTPSNDVSVHQDSETDVRRADDVLLAQLGYKSEFKREFSVGLIISYGKLLGIETIQLIETVAFSFSIMGIIASVTSTFSFPLAAGTCFCSTKGMSHP